jgi:hypothetical protein
MNAPEIELPVVDSETERVTRWRAGELERAGYDPAAAVELAEHIHVDLHLAVELLQKGCSPDLAYNILR